MSILLAIVLLIVGLAVLIVGAEMLVKGAAQIATQLGLSHFAVGVTVVAFGTSAPEMFASVGAAVQGVPDLAIGNVVGSNIANILLILGIGSVVAPIGVHRRVRMVELPIMVAITVGAVLLVLDQRLSRVEGGLLAAGLIGYVIFIIRAHKEDIEHGLEDAVGKPKPIWIDLLLVIAGIVGLGLGAKALVAGASQLALRAGVSEGVVGTTIVAFGTSLPELAATIRAATKKQSDIAVGNVIGSNVFNLLSVLGVTALVSPLTMDASMMAHVWIMLGVSVLLLVLCVVRPVLGRVVGSVFVLLYLTYVIVSYAIPGSN
ncbi:MAG: calcium/sodium antiporter [Phycisphaerales bacterium]|nr:calcium/sodium antiporter [Phycisphaerales bacterium]